MIYLKAGCSFFIAILMNFVIMLWKISLYRITLYWEDMDPDPLRILTDPDPEGQQLRILPCQEHCFIASLAFAISLLKNVFFFTFFLSASHYIS